LVALALTVSSTNSTAGEDAEDAIKRVIAGYQKSFNAGDLNGIMSLYMSDAVLMPADSPAQVGKQAIRAFMDGIFGQWSHDLKFDPIYVRVSDDLAFVRMEITGEVKAKDGGRSQSIHNKGLALLLRGEDGAWKFSQYMFNANVQRRL
jgi:uncharacterized protein (TIGR02246 family)